MLRKNLLATLCAGVLISAAVPVLAAPAQTMKSEDGTLEVTPIVTGLEHPWAPVSYTHLTLPTNREV